MDRRAELHEADSGQGNLAALKHAQGVGPRISLNQLYLHIGVTLRVTVQEAGQDAFDELSGPPPSALPCRRAELLRTLADCVREVQQGTAITEQLLTFASKYQSAPDPIKQLEAELLLKIADLPRQGRLRNTQAQGRLRDCPSSATVTKVRVRRRSIGLMPSGYQ